MSGGSLKPHQPPRASSSSTRESRAGHWVRCRGTVVVPLLCHPPGARSCPVLWLQPMVLRVTFPVHTWLAEGIPACSTLLWFRVSTEVEKKKGKKKVAMGNGNTGQLLCWLMFKQLSESPLPCCLHSLPLLTRGPFQLFGNFPILWLLLPM